MKVFVHGVPETAAVWSPLTAALNSRGVTDIVLLSPPGFGSATPPGWLAAPAEYKRWLAKELKSLRSDGTDRIDLVGHDWGAGHVMAVLSEDPDLVDSWATDCGGLFHPDYVWHDGAQTWQTPGEGEEALAGMLGLGPEVLADVYQGMGMTPAAAAGVAAGMDQAMITCILGLYRGAVPPYLSDLGRQLASSGTPPGLIISALDDEYAGTPAMANNTAQRLGASYAELVGAGHWWMCQEPELAADVLIEHWAS